MGTSLIEKLEGGSSGGGGSGIGSGAVASDKSSKVLEKLCENEIRELHKLFVTWFRGERPVNDLESDLCTRLVPSFSHVAPNGHMVKGRAVLLQYLTDKYGCYQDRVFSIDVYNVQLLWSSGNKCLASYEEWQSWDSVDDDDDDDDDDEDDDDDDDDDDTDNNNNNKKDDPAEVKGSPTSKSNNGSGTNNSTSNSVGKQQFGRLSTCLLEKDKKDGRFRWIHVHETWLEAEEPVVTNLPTTDDADDTANTDVNTVSGDETVMTGPVPPSEIAKRLAKQQAASLSSSTTPATAAATAASNTDSSSNSNNNNTLNSLPKNESDNRLTPGGLYNPKSLLGNESIHSTTSEGLENEGNMSSILTTTSTSTSTIPTTTTTKDEEDTSKQSTIAESTPMTEVSSVPTTTDQPESAPLVTDELTGATITTKPVTILVSLQSLSKTQLEQQQICLDILQNELRVTEEQLEIVDGTNPADRTRRNELFEISTLKAGTYPQIFTSSQIHSNEPTVTTFWGTYTEFEQCHGKENLLESLGLSTLTSPSSSNSNQLQQPDIATSVPTSPTRRTPFDDYEDSMLKFESSPKPDNSNDVITTANTGPTPKTPLADTTATEQKAKRRSMLVTPVDVETVDPEKEFLQRSQGILTFEDEDDDIVEYTNGTSSNGQALLSASSSSNDNKDKGEEPTGDTAGAKLESLVSPPDASKKRHVSLKLEKYAKPLVWDNALVGISIKGFDIGTSQGVAADSIWHTDMTQQLEAVAQSFSIPIPKRRLNLPEMIYPTAHVALEGFGLWLSWDATDALEAWAKCHQMIAVKSRIAWEGVNVMKAQDAKLWEQKAALAASPSKDSTEEGSSSDNNITKTKPESIFHYDWTFSTPFLVRAEGGEWIELDESGMRTELLKDQTVPILFFDDVILFEDDLHDNGIAHYSIKLRVMPTCAYILARLFIRVDNVILRLRETRVLIDFFGVKPKIYRDVTWKECHWEQLSEHNLPTDVKSWTISDSAPPQKVKEWQRLIELLPEVRLPKNYFQYATFEFD